MGKFAVAVINGSQALDETEAQMVKLIAMMIIAKNMRPNLKKGSPIRLKMPC